MLSELMKVLLPADLIYICRLFKQLVAKQKIKIDFSDFWVGFNKTNNYFFNLLSKYYEVEISDRPDFLIYSVFSHNYLKYSNCIRIFYTGENIRPDFRDCDFSFTFDFLDDPRNYRLPIYAIGCDMELLAKEKPDPDFLLKSKSKFCNFVYNNGKAKGRINFFHELSSRYKRVDSGGTLLNNIGGVAVGNKKREYIKDFKFTIAFENSSYPGYTTEKIAEPMMCYTIPIYWGNPLVGKDFNTKSFINCHDYKSFEEVMEHVIEVDKDDRLWKQYLSEPYFVNNTINEFVREENVIKQFDMIFSSKGKITPVSNTWKKYYSYYKAANRKVSKVAYKFFK